MRIALLLALGLLLVGCGGNGNGNGNGNESSAGGDTSMDCEIGGDESKAELADLEEGKTHSVVVETNKGSFTFELATDISPCTTAAFAGLVQKGFFDGLTFHRIVPGFVIQGGDPVGNGTGGPGYTTVDAPPQDTTYDKGLVAMAKAGNEPAGTSGSQFFVVSADGVQLDPDYAVLGRVTDGIDVVEAIGELGNPSDPSGRPTEDIDIEKMELQTG
jgi:peptidyl-prolyl cis-trans isomerase B (cyclophilin B)